MCFRLLYRRRSVRRSRRFRPMTQSRSSISFLFLLTNMHLSSYYNSMWDVESSEEYDEWFSGLDDSSKEAVYERILLLREFGPNLPRPYADVLHGSKKLSNLKELRNRTKDHELRVAYYFDPVRKAFLLTGGDKKGKDQTKFYKDLIFAAESIVERHEKELEDKK